MIILWTRNIIFIFYYSSANVYFLDTRIVSSLHSNLVITNYYLLLYRQVKRISGNLYNLPEITQLVKKRQHWELDVDLPYLKPYVLSNDTFFSKVLSQLLLNTFHIAKQRELGIHIPSLNFHS